MYKLTTELDIISRSYSTQPLYRLRTIIRIKDREYNVERWVNLDELLIKDIFDITMEDMKRSLRRTIEEELGNEK